MRTKGQQAKHVSDARFLHIVDVMRWSPYEHSGRMCFGSNETPRPRWVTIWEVQRAMPDVHPKVVAAKFAQLIRRKLVSGCTCGCRGDIEMKCEPPEVFPQRSLTQEAISQFKAFLRQLDVTNWEVFGARR